MRARLNTFKSKNGDCIFFRLNNGETDFNIMIDCPASDIAPYSYTIPME